LTLDKAEAKGFKVKPLDIAPAVLNNSAQRTRAVIVGANWTIVAECPTDGSVPSGQFVNVGVVKVAEMPIDLAQRAANGEFNHFVSCDATVSTTTSTTPQPTTTQPPTTTDTPTYSGGGSTYIPDPNYPNHPNYPNLHHNPLPNFSHHHR